MGQITLHPELVTSSGEACGIMLDDQYVGSLTLLYRENDRIWGSVQLDEEVLVAEQKEQVELFIHRYIESMIDAVGAPDCFVSTTYSAYDHIMSTEQIGEIEEVMGVEGDADYVQYEQLEVGPEDALFDEEEDVLNLHIVGESRNRVEYQLLNEHNELVADAILYIDRGEVYGDVFFHLEPEDVELDEVAEILVLDFDEDQIDTFEFDMYYDHEKIARIELAHDDLLLEEDELPEDDFLEDELLDRGEELYVDVFQDEGLPLILELLRDEGDSLIFDIYEQHEEKRIRLGTATIDLDHEPTALIDFVHPRDRHVREQIAYRLIEELDKEAEYETFSITMQYHDEVIDEYTFDVEDQRDLTYF